MLGTSQPPPTPLPRPITHTLCVCSQNSVSIKELSEIFSYALEHHLPCTGTCRNKFLSESCPLPPNVNVRLIRMYIPVYFLTQHCLSRLSCYKCVHYSLPNASHWQILCHAAHCVTAIRGASCLLQALHTSPHTPLTGDGNPYFTV